MRLCLALLLALVPCAGAAAAAPVKGDIAILTHQEGTPALEAATRLAQIGSPAVAPVEAALATASPLGRKNLILALRKIGDAAAIPRLQTLALQDRAPDVRREALWTLKLWAAGEKAAAKPSIKNRTPQQIEERAAQARTALRAIDEAHGRHEQG